MENVHNTFRELNLSQDQAQKVMDLYGKEIADAESAPYKLWLDTQETWRNEIKADPEIGGKLDQVTSTIAKAVSGLGDPKLANDFRTAVDYTGAGNNPAIIRTLYKMARMLTEGGPITAGNPSDAARPNARPSSLARAMYPNLPSGQGT